MPVELAPDPRYSPTTLLLLRLEGLAVAAGSAYFFYRSGVSWWLFALLWLTPDLSMLGYLAEPRWGARCYNAVHTYVGPAAVAAFALALPSPTLLPFALIWFNHIGFDRLLGYGLKSAEAFKISHLTPTRLKSGN